MLCVALINVSCVTGSGAEPFSCSSVGCGKLMLSMSAWRDLEVNFPVISIHDACTLHFSSTKNSSCKLATPLNCLITKCPNFLITFPSFYPLLLFAQSPFSFPSTFCYVLPCLPLTPPLLSGSLIMTYFPAASRSRHLGFGSRAAEGMTPQLRGREEDGVTLRRKEVKKGVKGKKE